MTHSIPVVMYLGSKIAEMALCSGCITDVIDSALPRERPLKTRHSPEIIGLAHRLKDKLRDGQMND